VLYLEVKYCWWAEVVIIEGKIASGGGGSDGVPVVEVSHV